MCLRHDITITVLKVLYPSGKTTCDHVAIYLHEKRRSYPKKEANFQNCTILKEWNKLKNTK